MTSLPLEGTTIGARPPHLWKRWGMALCPTPSDISSSSTSGSEGALFRLTNVGHFFICASYHGRLLLVGSGFPDPCTLDTFSFVLLAVPGFFSCRLGFPDSYTLKAYFILCLSSWWVSYAGWVFPTHASQAHFVLCLSS